MVLFFCAFLVFFWCSGWCSFSHKLNCVQFLLRIALTDLVLFLVVILRFAGAHFVICWCFFGSGSFLACAFILCSGGQMGSCSFCHFLVLFCLSSFLDCAFVLCFSGAVFAKHDLIFRSAGQVWVEMLFCLFLVLVAICALAGAFLCLQY